MLEWVNRYVFGVAVPLLLLLVGLSYLKILRFFPFTRLRAILRYFAKGEKQEGTTPLRALCLALAGTLGVGNIVGVSSAIYLGGFGAIFWMWVSALAAMILKYAEIVLALCYRGRREDGRFFGGAPYYIKGVLGGRGLLRLGGFLAGLFAILCLADSLFMGCIIQVNAVSGAMEGVLSVSPLVSGLVLAVVCFVLLVLGGNVTMAVTEKLVPLMSILYVILSLWCMCARRGDLPQALASILKGAFSAESAAGGVFGFLLSRALRFGTMRGLLSNEAGCGTSPIAHAASCAKSPVEQGFFGLVEVFVDTIVLCSMTAFVVILNYDAVSVYGEQPMMMTLKAYSAAFSGKVAMAVEGFLALAVLSFGFATIICWAHYGMEALSYLSRRKSARWGFILLYSGAAVLGSVMAPSAVWTLSDFAIGAMTVINVLVLVAARGRVKRETFLYFGIGEGKK